MERIGIFSFYYRNYNFGGILQAYALTRFLNTNLRSGIRAEQVCYDSKAVGLPLAERAVRFVCRGNLRSKLQRNKKAVSEYVLPDSNEIKKNIDEFAEHYIPHSDTVYDDATYLNAEQQYDCFIVGSDQVWNPIAVRDAYLLKGVKKPRISYAASIAAGKLKPLEKAKYRKELKHFSRISVREASAAVQLRPLTSKAVDIVVDPVFLLDRDIWMSLTNFEPRIKGKYVFIYFLSPPSEAMENVIEKYREEFEIVCLEKTYVRKEYTVIGKANPLDFLNLIRNAECVLTDSFHAIAFSVIFRTKFLVSIRQSANVDMSERIAGFLDLTDFGDKIVAGDGYNDGAYDFDKADRGLSKMIQHSKRFLEEALAEGGNAG